MSAKRFPIRGCCTGCIRDSAALKGPPHMMWAGPFRPGYEMGFPLISEYLYSIENDEEPTMRTSAVDFMLIGT